MSVPLLALVAYHLAACVERRRRGWSLWPTASFSLGCLLAAWALSPSFDAYADRRFDGHMAVGLVAFGAGLLLAALIPASGKETQVAHSAVEAVKEHGQPLIDQATSVGQDIGAHLQESATEAAQDVQATAQQSVDTIRIEGQSSAQTVKDEATPN